MDKQMNCFDFDKTIFKKDCSISFLLYCIKKRLVSVFYLFYVAFIVALKLIRVYSTTTLKEKYFSFIIKIDNLDKVIDDFWQVNIKYVNEWYLDIKSPTDVVCSASPEFLVKPCMNMINSDATVIASLIEVETAKFAGGGYNCKGKEKVDRILKHFGLEQVEQPIFNACYTDSISDLPLMDLAKNKYIVVKDKVYEFGKQKPSFTTKLKYLFKQLRVKHYVKNGLVFLPLIFSGNLSNGSYIFKSVMCFIAFSLVASVIYVINDIMDVEQDRLHYKKRHRPIACYMISKTEATALAVALLFCCFSICFFALDKNFILLAIIGFYMLLNIAYSTLLKKVPVIDVITLALCFLIRVYAGGYAIGVGISNWLYLTVLFGALFMGLGKRRNELKNMGDATRKVNKFYSYQFLDKNLYVCMACVCVFYSLWAITVAPTILGVLNGKMLLSSIPIVVAIIMKYSLNIEKAEGTGDPVDTFLKDAWLIVLAVIYLAVMVVSIYVPIYY